jgi:hypothetical protein
MTDEGLHFQNVDSTIAQRLAIQFNIQHHCIDLTGEERSLLSVDESAFVKLLTSIPSKDGGARFRSGFDRILSEIRERCWVARIIAKQQWPILLICGADHSQSIAKLWRRFGQNVVVLHSDYNPSTETSVPSSAPPT